MNEEQEKVWQEALRQVNKMRDKLGMPVDDGIAETVAIMQLMGIHTTMSCEGHPDRITEGPYVMFMSLEADKYRRQCVETGGVDGVNYRELYEKALIANLNAQQKIYQPLEMFYGSRVVPFGQMLTLRTMGFSANRLNCQGASIAHIADTKMRKQILVDSQNEMNAFTNYLKDLYFVK